MARRTWARCGLLLLLLGASDCGLFAFDVPGDISEQTIPGVPGAAPLAYSVTVTIQPDDQARSAARINLRSLSFTITDTARPPGDVDCWDFVDTVTVRIVSTQQGSTLPPQAIATGNMPGCVQTFDLVVDANANVAPYVIGGAQIVADVTGHVPDDPVSFVGHYVLTVHPF